MVALLYFEYYNIFLIYFKSGLSGDNVALKYTVKAGVLWYGAGKNLYALPFRTVR